MSGYQYYKNNQTITKQEFNEAHAILNHKIDSLFDLTQKIDSNIIEVKNNVEILKQGQVIIYNEVRKDTNKSFWDWLK